LFTEKCSKDTLTLTPLAAGSTKCIAMADPYHRPKVGRVRTIWILGTGAMVS
jgi:hypothetical protein